MSESNFVELRRLTPREALAKIADRLLGPHLDELTQRGLGIALVTIREDLPADEYTVRSEDGFVPTYDEDEQITARKGDVRAVLDAAVGSPYFSSGYMDNEEVEALRKCARLLGIPPLEVTPANFVCRYEGHDWQRVAIRYRWECARSGCPAVNVGDEKPAP